ncbi:DUF6098 family protein [Streptomyces sp. NRRL F-4474]|uniref:DUF6098 family protein n=1 Tax=Streptomyces sp. NRRL F-4474 TaxID=1463851 RepID=UPI001F22C6D5|nr:DUF6098 family protein [Streptomyces sp. NRRL F-4474]
MWAARRLFDHAHLPHVKDRRVRPWLLRGRQSGRGPDNEPLVTSIEPLGWIDRRSWPKPPRRSDGSAAGGGPWTGRAGTAARHSGRATSPASESHAGVISGDFPRMRYREEGRRPVTRRNAMHQEEP